MTFEFATATRILFGPGRVQELPGLAGGYGSRVLLVTGRHPARAGRIAELLKAAGLQTTVFSVPGEPEIQDVERGIALARDEKCELVVGCGGGSAIDAGKAISAMLTNPGRLSDYLEVVGSGKTLPNPTAPFIAIPTTAGTGSEVTRNAVLGVPEHQVKVSLRSPLMLPRAAVVDPELAHDLPSSVTASTGMDALTQLIEPYVSSRSNPLIDALCADGIPRVACSLLKAYRDGKDAAARANMSLASLLGGLALANAGLGAVHGFAGPIGGSFQAPHGAVCGALLPHIMAANIQALRARNPQGGVLQKYRQIAGWLTGNRDAAPDDGVDWVRDRVAELGIPKLASYGVRTADTAMLVGKAVAASSMKANPIVLTKDELSAALEAAV